MTQLFAVVESAFYQNGPIKPEVLHGIMSLLLIGINLTSTVSESNQCKKTFLLILSFLVTLKQGDFVSSHNY